jgi:hypothetical protein
MAGLMLKKEKKTKSWSLIKRSVETSRSPCIAAKSLAGPTSRRPCRLPDLKEASINNVQYPRIPNMILKGASHEEVVNDEAWQIDVNLVRMKCRDTQISYIVTESPAEPFEAC